jgi:hypothetical protein
MLNAIDLKEYQEIRIRCKENLYLQSSEVKVGSKMEENLETKSICKFRGKPYQKADICLDSDEAGRYG